MSGAAFLRSASWAPTVAMSWFWGLGFCFSMHVVLTYGWGAFAAFAATNATGLFLFGALCGRAGTDPARLFRIAQDRAGVALVAYQIVAVAITLYGFGRYVLVPMFGAGSAGGAAILLIASSAIGHAVGLPGLKKLHAVLLAGGAAAAAATLTALPGGEAPPVSAALDSRFLGLVVPSLVGFLLGPWLDVQQWQRAVAIRRAGGSTLLTYGLGSLLFLGLLCINAVLAVAAGPVVSAAASDGLPFAGGSLAAAAVRLDGGHGLASVAFLVWSTLAMATTLDSFYVAVRSTLKETMGRSTSALLALVPQGYATSPLWVGSIACGLAFAAFRLDLPFLYLMMPFATFFAAPAANLVAGALGAPVLHDAPLAFMLGICAMALFVAGHAADDPALLALSVLVPLLAAARSFAHVLKPGRDHRPAEIDAVTGGMPVQADPIVLRPVNDHGAAHGFEGKWFVVRITPTYDDTNSVGNVYFANYMRFVGKARELFFNAVMPDFDLATTRFLILTKSIAHDFRGEAKEFEPIEVRIGVRRWNRKFVTLEHEIRRSSGGVLGKGSQQLMFVDAEDYRLIDMPGDIVGNFGPYVLGDQPAAAAATGLPEAEAA